MLRGVLILGVILIVLGFVFAIPILYTLGVILAVIGVLLLVLDGAGRSVGGRRWY